MSEISGKETTIVEQTVRGSFAPIPTWKEVQERHADLHRDETTGAALARRWPCCGNDPQYLNDALLTWLSTILRGVGFGAALHRNTYKTLALVAGRELSPATGLASVGAAVRRAVGREASDASKEAVAMAGRACVPLNYFGSPVVHPQRATGRCAAQPRWARLVGDQRRLSAWLRAGLRAQTGPATGLVLRRCGSFFGARLARRSEAELSVYLSRSLRATARRQSSPSWCRPVAEQRHGRAPHRLVARSVRLSFGKLLNSPMGHRAQGAPADDLFEGLIEGFLGHFTDESLTCIQTGDLRLGDKDGTTFVLVPPDLGARVREASPQQALTLADCRAAGWTVGRRLATGDWG